MKNLETTPVQLTGGAGLVSRPTRNYLPGEYANLLNVTLTNRGSIIKRKPANGLKHPHATPLLRMIGSWGPSAVYSSQITDNGTAGAAYQDTLSPTLYYSYGNNEIRQMTITNYDAFKTALYSAAAVDGGFPDLEGQDYFTFEGCFQYNNKAYFIILVTNKYVDGASTVNYRNILYVIEATGFRDFKAEEPISISLSTSLFEPVFINTQNYPSTVSFNPVPAEYVSSYFIYKNRLWIHSLDTILFSKATDLQRFATADGGGFFKFPGKNITDAVFLGNNIYVIFDTSISVLTYQTDPNIDSSIIDISNGIGGKSACIYGDTVYVLDFNNIYAVNGNNVSIFAELQRSLLGAYPQYATSHTDLINASSTGLNIEAFDGFLYFTGYNLYFSTKQGSIWCVGRGSGVGMYKISLEDGHISEETFSKNGEGIGRNPCDMKVIAYSTGLKTDHRMFMLFARTSSIFNYASGSFFYNLNNSFFINNISSREAGVDSFSNPTGTSLTVRPIIVEIEIKRWSPDGFMYNQKKFRHLMVHGKIPSLVKNAVLTDASTYSPELDILILSGSRQKELLDTKSLSTVVHANLDQFSIAYDGTKGFSYRINQRLTNLDIIFRTKNDYVDQDISEWAEFGDNSATSAAIASLMEINDVSFVWTPLLSGTDNDKRYKSPY